MRNVIIWHFLEGGGGLKFHYICFSILRPLIFVVVLLFYVHGKHLRSCWDGQLT